MNMKLTVSEYAEKFLYFKNQQVTRKKLKQTTYDRLEGIYKTQLENHRISNVLMCNLKSSDIQSLIDELQPNYSFQQEKTNP